MRKRRKESPVEPRRNGRRWILWGAPVLVLALGTGFALANRREQPPADAPGVRPVSFAELSSFPYSSSSRRMEKADARPDPFPREIRALDGKRITISGYMVPLHFQAGKIESFFLSRGGFACCYADAPKVTDYIKVSMPPGQFAPMSDLASVSGVLQVGEELDSSGWVETVYRMTAESVKPDAARPPGGWADYFLGGLAAVGVLILMGSFAINVLKPWLRARHIGLKWIR